MADKQSRAEKTADKVVAHQRRTAAAAQTDEERRLAEQDDEQAKQTWLENHQAHVARFEAQLRDTGIHPVTGQALRRAGYTDEHHAAAVSRFEDYLLGEADADMDVDEPHETPREAPRKENP